MADMLEAAVVPQIPELLGRAWLASQESGVTNLRPTRCKTVISGPET